MALEVAMPVYVTAGLATAITIAFSLPPLTFDGNEEATRSAMAQHERSFCDSNLSRVNCVCFARVSSAIREDPQRRVSGFVYADQRQIARIQAQQSC